MAIDLDKVIKKIQEAKTVNEVKTVKGEDKNEVFNDDEKSLFLTQVGLDEAKKAGEILVKIKAAKEKKVKNDSLLDELENEKNANGYRGSQAYRLLNKNGLVEDTISFLSIISVGIPEEKSKREEKVKQLKKELGDKRLELANTNSSLKPLEGQLEALIVERDQAKKGKTRRQNLLSLLSRDPNDASFTLSRGGTDTAIALIPINNVKDYDGSKLYDGSASASVSNVKDILIKAENYLKEVIKSGDQEQVYVENYHASNLTYFDDREYQSKYNLTASMKNIGYTMLLAFRKIGDTKLKALVKASGSSKKDQLEKYVDKMLKWVHWSEEIANEQGYRVEKDSAEGFDKRVKTWISNLPRKNKDEYPFTDSVEWEKVFEFMTEVFPLKDNSNTRNGLQDKDYLVKESDPNFIKTDDSSKWNEVIKVGGYASAPTVGSKKTIGWYSKQSSTPRADLIKSQIKNPKKFPSDWSFAQAIGLWYDAFSPFVDFSTAKWKAGKDVAGEPMKSDRKLEKWRNELRYCLTMRELLLELGMSQEIDEFDDYLVEIADYAEKKGWIGSDRSKVIKISGEDINEESGHTGAYMFWKAVADQVIWKGDHNKTNKEKLEELIKDSDSSASSYDSKIEGMQKSLTSLMEKSSSLTFEIDKIKKEIALLERADEFDDQPLPDKKKSFNDLYDKKGQQGDKWTLHDVKLLVLYLTKLEKELDTSEFKKDFESKKTEVNEIIEKATLIIGNIGVYWQVEKNKTGSALGAIKGILKDEESGKKTLEDISSWFKDLSDLVILENVESEDKTKIDEAIVDPTKFKEGPASGLTKEKLTEVFGFDVDENLLTSWRTISSLSEQKIKDNVGKYAKKTNKTNFDALMAHLKEKGEGFKGGSKTDYTDATDDTKKDGIWSKFIKKGPQVVIETVVEHEFEGNKDTKRTEVEGKKDSNDQPLDKSEYGDGESFTDDGVKKFIYEEKIGKSHKFTSKPQEDDGKDQEGEKTFWDKYIAGWYYTPLWVPPLIVAALVVIFWKNISEWWNGPAEEEGAGSEKNGEEEVEEDN